MSSSTGTIELSNIVSLSSDNNPDQTQEISHVGEQPVDQEMVGSDTGCEEVVGTMSRPSGTDDNPNQTQEISHVREQNVDKEMVGLNIGKSSHTKQKKLRSDVWTKFEKFKDENGNDLAKCNLCEKLFDGSSKKGTTHLKNHFKSCQNICLIGCQGVFGTMSRPRGTDDNPKQTQEISHVREQNVDKEMVGLNIGKSSHSKQKKLRSDVWTKFEKFKDENGKDLAKCSLCEKLFDGSSKKGTTHLRNHFKSCQNKRNEGGASGSGDKQLNHLDRVKMLIKQWNWFLPKPIGMVDAGIINVYNKEKEKLRMYLEKLCCRFSLTITNVGAGKYTGFMVRFIDDDWKLEVKMIGLKCIEGDQNMKVLKNVLSDLGIDNNISFTVTDGDSDIYVLSSDERENRFSCQGSCIHNFSYIDETCPDLEIEMGEVLFGHMSKILNYVLETSSKNGTFKIAIDTARSLGKEVTAVEHIPTKEKLKYVDWFDLLKIALGLTEAFFELEIMDPDFKSINLTKEQWDVLTTFYQSCREDYFGRTSLTFYSDFSTANIYFHMLCLMYKKSLVLVTLNSFIGGERHLLFIKDAKKCWDQCNLILAVAAVLDPQCKMDIVKRWYKKIYGDGCETQLEKFMDHFNSVYNEYAKGTDNFQSSISYDILGNSSHDQDSGWPFNFELHLYLKDFPLIEDFHILKWWQLHSRYFPTLAKMARDFLSIRITTDSYMSGRLYPIHYFLGSDIVKEALLCTKIWLTDEEY